jgi:hypothetical protein
MAKVNRIYKPNTRDQVSCLTQLVGIQKKHLLEILESIKPAVLTASVPCDGTNFADLGMYFQVTQNKKYALKVECTFTSADPDGVVELAIGPVANLAEFKFLGFSFNSDSTVSAADEVANYTATSQGIAWVPTAEASVAYGYGTLFFQVRESNTLALSYKAGSGDTEMLAPSNFTLTEIETND